MAAEQKQPNPQRNWIERNGPVIFVLGALALVALVAIFASK